MLYGGSCKNLFVTKLSVQQVKNEKLHFLSYHNPLALLNTLKGDGMLSAILTEEFASLSLCVGGRKMFFLHCSLCDFSLLCKGSDPVLFHGKFMPLEEQAQHSEDLASVSESTLV